MGTVVVWGEDIFAGCLHRVGASREDDLCGVAPVVERGSWRRQIHGKRDVRVRGWRGRELRFRWNGVSIS
jgi:hypothetical protein